MEFVLCWRLSALDWAASVLSFRFCQRHRCFCLQSFCLQKVPNGSNGLYQKYLADFVATRSMTKRTKIRILAFVTVLIAIGFWFSPVFAKVILAAVLLFHYAYFLFGIKTIDEKADKVKNREIRVE